MKVNDKLISIITRSVALVASILVGARLARKKNERTDGDDAKEAGEAPKVIPTSPIPDSTEPGKTESGRKIILVALAGTVAGGLITALTIFLLQRNDTSSSLAKSPGGLDETRLRDPDANARRRYVVEVTSMDPDSSVPALRRMLATDSSEDLKALAAGGLAFIGRPQADRILIDTARSGASIVVRVAAVEGLGDLPFTSRSSLELLLEGTYDPEPAVRAASVKALGKRGEAGTLPAIARLVSDPDVAVAAPAATALGELGDRAGLPVLTEALRSAPAIVRARAALSIGHIPDPAVPALLANVALSRRQEIGVRVAAIRGLMRLSEAERVAVDLSSLARNDNAEIRAAAAYVIATSERGNVVGTIRTLASDRDTRVTMATVDAMALVPQRFLRQMVEVAVDREAAEPLRVLAVTGLSDAEPSILATNDIFNRLVRLLSITESEDLQVSGVYLMAYIGSGPARQALLRFRAEQPLTPRVSAAVEEARQRITTPPPSAK